MATPASPVLVRQHSPAYWRVTSGNPPINMYDADVLAGLRDAVDRQSKPRHTRPADQKLAAICLLMADISQKYQFHIHGVDTDWRRRRHGAD